MLQWSKTNYEILFQKSLSKCQIKKKERMKKSKKEMPKALRNSKKNKIISFFLKIASFLFQFFLNVSILFMNIE